MTWLRGGLKDDDTTQRLIVPIEQSAASKLNAVLDLCGQHPSLQAFLR